MNLQPIERPVVIERPSTKRRLAVSSRLMTRRAKRNPRTLILPGLIALAAVISTVAVLEATRVGDEPVATLAAATEAAQSVEAQVRESATVVDKDEARLTSDETEATEAAPEPVTAGVQTASIGRPADPAIAAIASATESAPVAAPDMAAQAVEPMPAAGTLAEPDASALAGVEIAESEDEVLALEASLLEEGSSGAFEVSTASMAVSNETTASIPTGLSEARVNSYVNMRATPDNDGQVIRVVPTNATVQASTDCRHFCEVVHEGTRGYIYKSYLSR